MKLNLREEETKNYVAFFRGYLENLQNLNKKVFDELNLVRVQSKHDKLQKTAFDIIDDYIDNVGNGVEVNAFSNWKESDASLWACLHMYEAGDAAEAVCVQVEQEIKDLMVNLLRIEKPEAVVTDRPLVNEEALSKLEESCKAAQNEVQDIQTDFGAQVDVNAEENDIYGVLKPLGVRLLTHVGSFYERSLNRIKNLHEEMHENAEKQKMSFEESLNQSFGQKFDQNTSFADESAGGAPSTMSSGIKGGVDSDDVSSVRSVDSKRNSDNSELNNEQGNDAVEGEHISAQDRYNRLRESIKRDEGSILSWMKQYRDLIDNKGTTNKISQTVGSKIMEMLLEATCSNPLSLFAKPLAKGYRYENSKIGEGTSTSGYMKDYYREKEQIKYMNIVKKWAPEKINQNIDNMYFNIFHEIICEMTSAEAELFEKAMFNAMYCMEKEKYMRAPKGKGLYIKVNQYFDIYYGIFLNLFKASFDQGDTRATKYTNLICEKLKKRYNIQPDFNLDYLDVEKVRATCTECVW